MVKIKELFASIQGEGPFIGYKQVFIRLCGCNLKCKYCDTDFELKNAKDYSIEELITFTDKNNFMYKVYYYSHLYDKDNVFKKVTLDNEEYFSILDRDNSYCTYSKERSYYCGKHVWEKSNNSEYAKIISMFIYLYGPEILCDEKKLIKKK